MDKYLNALKIMDKYLNAIETISDILQSNSSDKTKIKLIGDAVDALNKF